MILSVGVALAQFLEQRRSIHFRHHYVGNDEIDIAAMLLELLDRLDAIAGFDHPVAA